MSQEDHARHCFVAIPFGRTTEEKQFFEGWTNEVIVPAIGDDFDPIVATLSTLPTSITNEIFEHLLWDPIAIFDLGGATPNAPANPNVMYELGIRHAFRLPSVILAWEQQELPFDIGDVRAVKMDRIAFHFPEARRRIKEFIKSAAEGKFYDPLESFAHRAAIEKIGSGSGEMALVATQLAELAAKIDALVNASRPSRVVVNPQAQDESSQISMIPRLFRSDEAFEAVVRYLTDHGQGLVHQRNEFPELVAADDPHTGWIVIDHRRRVGPWGPLLATLNRIAKAVDSFGSPSPNITVVIITSADRAQQEAAVVREQRQRNQRDYPFAIVTGSISEQGFVPLTPPVASRLQAKP